MRRRLSLATVFLAICAPALAGCGGSDSGDDPEPQPAPPAEQAETAPPAETEVETSSLGDPAAGEASPEAEAEGAGEVSNLPEGDDAAVRAAVEGYIAALNAGDGGAVCGALAPGALALRELPIRRGGCAASVEASIGHRRPGGVPAWKRTRIIDVTAVSVGDREARVTATVTHRFADRDYTSVEEDVVYLREDAGSWLLAKPSGTLYRAVGYPEPPLRALAPPP